MATLSGTAASISLMAAGVRRVWEAREANSRSAASRSSVAALDAVARVRHALEARNLVVHAGYTEAISAGVTLRPSPGGRKLPPITGRGAARRRVDLSRSQTARRARRHPRAGRLV